MRKAGFYWKAARMAWSLYRLGRSMPWSRQRSLQLVVDGLNEVAERLRDYHRED